MHWSYFPQTHGRQHLDDTLHEELSGIILHGIVGKSYCFIFANDDGESFADTMNSMTSTMPHSLTELGSMLTLIKKVQGVCAMCLYISDV